MLAKQVGDFEFEVGQYTVYTQKEPFGCSCKKINCLHVKAVMDKLGIKDEPKQPEIPMKPVEEKGEELKEEIKEEPTIDEVVDGELDPIVQEETGSAVMIQTKTDVAKLSKEEYFAKLEEQVEIAEFQRKIITKVCKSYLCWYKSKSGQYLITGPGVKRIMRTLGICMTAPKYEITTREDGSIRVVCKFDMWQRFDPENIASVEGTVTSSESFYATSGGEKRNQKDVVAQKEAKIKSHAKTRALKEGATLLFGISPTVEELKEVGVELAKVQEVKY